MYKVLVLEDEKTERETLLDILRRNFSRGLELYDASNGRTGTRIAVLRSVDLVLMDVRLPGMSGIKIAREIKKQLPGSKIIFITAYRRFDLVQAALRLGASDYILKPYTERSIVTAVKLALSELDARQRLISLIPETLPEAISTEAQDDTYDPQMAEIIHHVQEYLDNNYMNPVSLEYVSEILKISPSYLSTQFKRYAHVHFVEYLNEVRIREASRLLTDPLRPVSEVARLAGYDNANYFSRVFKKYTGLPPSRYRRQHARPSDKNRKKH